MKTKLLRKIAAEDRRRERDEKREQRRQRRRSRGEHHGAASAPAAGGAMPADPDATTLSTASWSWRLDLRAHRQGSGERRRDAERAEVHHHPPEWFG
jgi:hypothetical protein